MNYGNVHPRSVPILEWLNRETGERRMMEWSDDASSLSEATVERLAELIDETDDPQAIGIIGQILRGSKRPFDGRPACRAFERLPKARWDIGASIIGYSTAQNVKPWIEDAMLNPEFGSLRDEGEKPDRDALCFAIRRQFTTAVDKERARNILLAALREVPAGVCLEFARFGRPEDIPFVQQVQKEMDRDLPSDKRWILKSFDTCLKKLQKKADRETQKAVRAAVKTKTKPTTRRTPNPKPKA